MTRSAPNGLLAILSMGLLTACDPYPRSNPVDPEYEATTASCAASGLRTILGVVPAALQPVATVAGGVDGGIAVWGDSEGQILLRTFGATTVDAPVSLAPDAVAARAVAVAALPQGWVACWLRRTVDCQVIDSTGHPVGDDVTVSDPSADSPSRAWVSVVSAAGTIWVAWHGSGYASRPQLISVRPLDSSLIPLGPPTQIAEGSGSSGVTSASLAVSGSRNALTFGYESNVGPSIQLLDERGNVMGPEQRLTLGNGGTQAIAPTVVGVPSGFFVAWLAPYGYGSGCLVTTDGMAPRCVSLPAFHSNYSFRLGATQIGSDVAVLDGAGALTIVNGDGTVVSTGRVAIGGTRNRVLAGPVAVGPTLAFLLTEPAPSAPNMTVTLSGAQCSW